MSNKRIVTVPDDGQTIDFTREFEAPAQRVFDAHVDPEIVARWTGPAGTSVAMRHWNAQSGGSWSYVVTPPTGDEGGWAFHGSFHEVTAPRRIVQTFEFEGDPGHPTLEVLEFVDLPGGRSRIDGRSVFLSVADRDAMLSGMDSGMDENFDRLEALLAEEPALAGR